MSRIDTIIEEAKARRVGKNRAWIFNEDGSLRKDVLLCDIIPILEELKNYEIEPYMAETVSDIINNCDGADNSYNYGGNVSNDFQYYYKEYEDGGITMAFQVHLGGDIRGNYSDFALLHFDYIEEFFELEDATQYIMVTDEMVADVNAFSEEYNVYDCKNQEDIGYFWRLELNDLLAEIADRKNIETLKYINDRGC